MRSIAAFLSLMFVVLGAGCAGAPSDSPPTRDLAEASDQSPAPSVDGAARSDQGDHAISDGGARPAALIADDFESASLDGARWSVLGAEGNQAPGATTAVIDETRAHGGAHSLRVRDGFIQTLPPDSAFYGRAFVWFDADPGVGHWMSWVGIGPGSAQGTEVRYGGHYGILEANYFGNDDEVISDPKGYCAPTCDNGVVMPVRRWACVEFYFGKDEMRLWLDGNEIETLHVGAWRNKTPPWSPEYDRVRLGFHNFQGPAPDVWYDDVALDTQRIGCSVP